MVSPRVLGEAQGVLASMKALMEGVGPLAFVSAHVNSKLCTMTAMAKHTISEMATVEAAAKSDDRHTLRGKARFWHL